MKDKDGIEWPELSEENYRLGFRLKPRLVWRNNRLKYAFPPKPTGTSEGAAG